jgi:hypothetical protein
MIKTDTLATLQRLAVSVIVAPVFTAEGPALDVTLEHGQGSARCRWAGRAMGPELVDRCVQRGLPTLIERMGKFKAAPEETVR